MKRLAPARAPRKRTQRLIVDELPDEVLVYDLDRDKAHCLNETAALVWKACDGRTPPKEIAARLRRKLQTEVNEEMVWLALRQLDQIHLLEEQVTLPPRFADVSRRRMMRNLGLGAAAAVPVVASLVAPTAAEAQTCIASGTTCSMTISCCSKMSCGLDGKCP